MQSQSGSVILSCFASIAFAIIYHFVYPGIDYIIALLNFGESPSILSAVKEFGPIYGKLDNASPGFFKGMAEASDQISGEHPVLAELPYMAKAALLINMSIPLYVLLVIIFLIVSFMSFLSYVLPWRYPKLVSQGIAIFLAFVPMLAVSLWCISSFLLVYIQALFSSVIDFVFLIFISPAVFFRVTVAWMGVFMLAVFFVPTGLVFAGRGSLARKIRYSLSGTL
jgi:hypothetical protein